MTKRYSCVSKHSRVDFSYCEECVRKQVEIDRLKEEMEMLKAVVRYRKKGRAYSPLFGSSTPSSKIEIKENSKEEAQKKSGGAECGHKGVGRKIFKRAEADEVVGLKVELKNCPSCGGDLEYKGIDERCIIDAALSEAYKVIYECELKRCKCCLKEVSKRPLVLPRSKYGNGLISNAIVMHYAEGIPLKQIAKLFTISHGALLHIFHKLAEKWAPVVEKLKTEYQKAVVKHADETGWRTDGKNGYAWLFCTVDLSLFKFGETREGQVARDMLGSTPEGILVVDRYSGYNKVGCDIQYCYAHLLRDLQDVEKENSKNEEVKNFVASLAPLLAKAMGLRREASSDDIYYTEAKKLKTQILDICKADSQHLGIGTFQSLFLDNEHRLFHWVLDRRVPPDNNRAERELRPTIISRKMSFGSQSTRGTQTRSVLMSILHTASKRLTQEGPSLRQWVSESLEKIAKDPDCDLYTFLPPS